MYLKKLLKEKLNAGDYESLHKTMGITPTRRTQMLNRPESMSKEEIQKILQIINDVEIDASYLITECGCGKEKLTVSEAEELTEKTE